MPILSQAIDATDPLNSDSGSDVIVLHNNGRCFFLQCTCYIYWNDSYIELIVHRSTPWSEGRQHSVAIGNSLNPLLHVELKQFT